MLLVVITILTNAINLKFALGRFKTVTLGEVILKIFQLQIIDITASPANDTDHMVIMLTSVFAFELTDMITESDFGTQTAFLQNPDRSENLRLQCNRIDRCRFFFDHTRFLFTHRTSSGKDPPLLTSLT